MKQWNKNTNAITEVQKLKERKQVMRDIGASERDFFTHMGAVTVALVVARGKQCGCKEEEGHRHTERKRESARDRNRKGGRQAYNDNEKAGGKHS